MADGKQYEQGNGQTESDQGAEDAIAQNLKRVFDQVASEPIPDQLQSLLDQLKSSGGK